MMSFLEISFSILFEAKQFLKGGSQITKAIGGAPIASSQVTFDVLCVFLNALQNSWVFKRLVNISQSQTLLESKFFCEKNARDCLKSK